MGKLFSYGRIARGKNLPALFIEARWSEITAWRNRDIEHFRGVHPTSITVRERVETLAMHAPKPGSVRANLPRICLRNTNTRRAGRLRGTSQHCRRAPSHVGHQIRCNRAHGLRPLEIVGCSCRYCCRRCIMLGSFLSVGGIGKTLSDGQHAVHDHGVDAVLDLELRSSQH